MQRSRQGLGRPGHIHSAPMWDQARRLRGKAARGDRSALLLFNEWSGFMHLHSENGVV